MADWTTIPDSSLEVDKPIRSIDGMALRDNPIAIAERAVDAPRVGMATLEVLTASGNYTVPDGVTRLRVYVIGGGGGGGTASAGAGGNSVFDTTVIGNGGAAGGSSPGAGGSASGGDLNLSGLAGSTALVADHDGGVTDYVSFGGASVGPFGAPANLRTDLAGAIPGGGGNVRDDGETPDPNPPLGGGGGGGCAIASITVTPGESIAYTIGAGGTAGTNGTAGGAGRIYVEY